MNPDNLEAAERTVGMAAYNMPPPAYEEAVSMRQMEDWYIPPPNYHDIVSGYIDPRPSININELVGTETEFTPVLHSANIQHLAEEDSVTINGKTFCDMAAVGILIVYYIPMYILSPLFYSMFFSHISQVLNENSKIFPNGIRSFSTKSIFLEYSIIIVAFLIFKTIILFFVGRLSYLDFLSEKLKMEANLSFALSFIMFFLNFVILKSVCNAYSEYSSIIQPYKEILKNAEHFVLLLAYYIILTWYLNKIYKYIKRWDGVYYKSRARYQNCSIYQIRLYIVFSILLSFIGLTGSLCLICDKILNVIALVGVAITSIR